MLRTSRGFTLLEVMIAVAVVAIALVTVIGSQSQSVSIAAIARFDTDAALLAQQRLTELALEVRDGISADEGSFSEPFDGYGWRLEITDLAEEDTGITNAEDLLVALDLSVYLESDEASSFSVRRILYIPPEEEP